MNPSTSFLMNCAKTYNDNDPNTPTGGAGPAFQIDGSGGCKRLGDSAANGKFDLIMDDTDVGRNNRLYSHGAYIKYQNGDSCLALNGSFVPRSVLLVVECLDAPLNIQTERVYEDVACEYRIDVKSRFGCPLQCTGGAKSAGSQVCGGHGVCGYDATNSKAKCFCNEGWTGSYCYDKGAILKPTVLFYGSNIAGSFVGGLAVGLFGVIAFFVARTIKAGGTWKEGLDLSKAFPTGGSDAYAYKPASDVSPAFAGFAGSAYEAPSTDAPSLSGGGGGGGGGGYSAPSADFA